MSDGVPVFITELVKLPWALWWLEEVGPVKAVLCSDSAAALMGLSRVRSRARPDLIGEILIQVYRLENEAEWATIDVMVSLSGMSVVVYRKVIINQLQKEWEEETVFLNQPRVNSHREDDIKLTRLRLGHCGLWSGLKQNGKCQECGDRDCSTCDASVPL